MAHQQDHWISKNGWGQFHFVLHLRSDAVWTLFPMGITILNTQQHIVGNPIPWGGLQFSSRHQSPRRGRGVRGGGGFENFSPFWGHF